ncbi:fibronectin [Bacillus wiedmannii]|uniref:Fibronectin n=1 Tax=Bacillus wiedmannii TaxID=1890302 RepID=A0A2B6UGA9_9BACI|nr:fibronectin [Bacillus wiedmannii]PGA87342.1 fibronectin [Bacillus wiedmannii]PGD65197.1 fibronectin [Bacillus wiedmannii]PHG59309.1 fibronectin [Bacillus wiedmannii]
MPTDIYLPPKIGVLHLYIFEEGVFCRKTIKYTIAKEKHTM